MSRWSQLFDSMDAVSVLNDFIQRLSEYEFDKSNTVEFQELARAKKILIFLRGVFESADPEYFPLNIINQMKTQLNNAGSQIEAYVSRGNIGDIQNLNNTLDNIISQTKPFYPLHKGTAISFGKAIKRYTNHIEESLKEVSQIAMEIQEYYDRLFEEGGVRDSVENLVRNLKEKMNDIEDVYIYLFEEDDENDSRINQIKSSIVEIKEILSKAGSILKKENVYFNEIKDHYEYIFGVEEDIDGNPVGGGD